MESEITEKNRKLIQENYIKSAVEVGNIEEAKKIVKDITNDKDISSNTIFAAQMQLLKALRKKELFEDAKLIIQDILGENEISDKVKNMVQFELMSIAVDEGKPEQAEWIGEYMLQNSSNMTVEEEVTVQSRLIKLEMKKGEYNSAKKRVEQTLKIEGINEKQLTKIKSQLVAIYTDEGDYEKAQKLLDEMLGNPTLLEGTKVMLKTQLDRINSKIASNPQVNLTEENKEINDCENKKYERFDNGNLFTVEDVKRIEESYMAKNYYKGKASKYTRSNLYSGNINIGDLEKLTDENSKYLPGCIFIAETCKYLGLNQLGIQALKGFKRNNLVLSNNEKKVLNEAIELIKIKKSVVTRKEEWDKLYQELERDYNVR